MLCETIALSVRTLMLHAEIGDFYECSVEIEERLDLDSAGTCSVSALTRNIRFGRFQ